MRDISGTRVKAHVADTNGEMVFPRGPHKPKANTRPKVIAITSGISPTGL